MRVGLYGLPCAGKSFILEKIKDRKVIQGSIMMKKLFPNFDVVDERGKKEIRTKFAKWLFSEDDFIMDGHYAFGNDIVFTEADGELYDVFLYLYIEQKELHRRMKNSEKNRKYAELDIEKWQKLEIEQLRNYCHKSEESIEITSPRCKEYTRIFAGLRPNICSTAIA